MYMLMFLFYLIARRIAVSMTKFSQLIEIIFQNQNLYHLGIYEILICATMHIMNI